MIMLARRIGRGRWSARWWLALITLTAAMFPVVHHAEAALAQSSVTVDLGAPESWQFINGSRDCQNLFRAGNVRFSQHQSYVFVAGATATQAATAMGRTLQWTRASGSDGSWTTTTHTVTEAPAAAGWTGTLGRLTGQDASPTTGGRCFGGSTAGRWFVVEPVMRHPDDSAGGYVAALSWGPPPPTRSHDAAEIWATTGECETPHRLAVTPVVVRVEIGGQPHIRIGATVVQHGYCAPGGGGLYLHWDRLTLDGVYQPRGSGLLPATTTCLDDASPAAQPALSATWRLTIVHVDGTAAEMASATGCTRGAARQFGAFTPQAVATVVARSLDDVAVSWSCPATVPAAGVNPVTACTTVRPGPGPGNVTADTEAIEPYTLALAIGRLAECWTTSETDDDDQPGDDLAQTPGDDGGFLSRAWDRLTRLPGDVVGTVEDTVDGIGRWMLWAVTAIGCMFWTLVVPDAEHMSDIMLSGRNTECEAHTYATSGVTDYEGQPLIRCSEVALLTWWLPLLADTPYDCRGPNVPIGTWLEPVAGIRTDEAAALNPAARGEMAAAMTASLDGHHVSTCSTTTLGLGASAMRSTLTAVVLLMAMALTWLLVRALPSLLSARGGE